MIFVCLSFRRNRNNHHNRRCHNCQNFAWIYIRATQYIRLPLPLLRRQS
jgi:hypothetical protein